MLSSASIRFSQGALEQHALRVFVRDLAAHVGAVSAMQITIFFDEDSTALQAEILSGKFDRKSKNAVECFAAFEFVG